MCRAFGILLTSLLILLGSMVLPGPDIVQAQALCTDGQEMRGGRNACICRPPLKFLPGNVCGSGRPAATAPQQPTGIDKLHRATTCQPNDVPAAQGCRCVPPMVVLPGGRCNNPTAAGAKCLQGQNIAQARCTCTPPNMRSAQGHCIRCLPGDGDKVVNGVCVQAAARPR